MHSGGDNQAPLSVRGSEQNLNACVSSASPAATPSLVIFQQITGLTKWVNKQKGIILELMHKSFEKMSQRKQMKNLDRSFNMIKKVIQTVCYVYVF